MDKKTEHNNPKKTFKEQDDLVVPGKKAPEAAEKLTSIRRPEITSIAPDDINWSKIYVGKQHGLHSNKPGVDHRKRGTH